MRQRESYVQKRGKDRFSAFGAGRVARVRFDPANELDGTDLAGKNGCMKFVVRVVQAGFVWLAAVTTLVAGLPHFDCVCPNGTHKPFCLGVSSPRTGCCCGGSCCSSSSGGKCCCQAQDSSADAQANQSSCCESQRKPSSETPSKGIRVNNSCCQKTAVAAEFIGFSPTNESAKQSMTAGFSALLPQLSFALTEPMAGSSSFPWSCYGLPPPTDLVITLQHFLI